MTDIGKDDDPLEILFARARQDPPEPPADLLARIAGEGIALQAAAIATAARERGAMARPRGWAQRWRAAFEILGGRAGVTGLVSAALVGLVLGFAQPGQLAPLGQSVSKSLIGADSAAVDQLTLIPSFDTFLSEG